MLLLHQKNYKNKLDIALMKAFSIVLQTHSALVYLPIQKEKRLWQRKNQALQRKGR